MPYIKKDFIERLIDRVDIVDVIAVGNTVYVVKPDRISKLQDSKTLKPTNVLLKD